MTRINALKYAFKVTIVTSIQQGKHSQLHYDTKILSRPLCEHWKWLLYYSILTFFYCYRSWSKHCIKPHLSEQFYLQRNMVTNTGRKNKFPIVLQIKEKYRTCRSHISSRFTGSKTGNSLVSFLWCRILMHIRLTTIMAV